MVTRVVFSCFHNFSPLPPCRMSEQLLQSVSRVASSSNVSTCLMAYLLEEINHVPLIVEMSH